MMTRIAWFFMMCFALGAGFGLNGCAYRFGQGERSLPGGYHQLSIPMFKNRTQEVGVESAFTQALQQEFRRSKVARIVDDPLAEVRTEGEIISIDSAADAKQSEGPYLPREAVIAALYRVRIVSQVRLVRRSDNEVLWAARIENETSYPAPRVTLSGLNSVNPLYDLSARRQKIEELSREMMVEAHGRMTENF